MAEALTFVIMYARAFVSRNFVFAVVNCFSLICEYLFQRSRSYQLREKLEVTGVEVKSLRIPLPTKGLTYF